MKNYLAAAFCLLISISNICIASPNVAEKCLIDLNSIPNYLLENDAGAKDHLLQAGKEHFDIAFANAKGAIAKVTDAASCSFVLNNYLKEWRKGHLWIVDTPDDSKEKISKNANAIGPTENMQPSLHILSDQTIVIALNTFSLPFREFFEENRQILETHPLWIVDVRNNNGGSDSNFIPFLPWLITNETVIVDGEWLVTAENMRQVQQSCAPNDPTYQECVQVIDQLVERMRKAEPGTFIRQNVEDGIFYMKKYKPIETKQPKQVAVLIDKGCVSACEQFLLGVRQSFSVKLLGRRTFGALDYSNLVGHILPSGDRVLWYAISRSKRIDKMPVDNIGVLPDIYLPNPTDENGYRQEVMRVQRWLEGGSLKPDNL